MYKCVAVIVGVLEMVCETVDEVMSHLDRGLTSRHTSVTSMNEHSSRSHAVFTLVIGVSCLPLIASLSRTALLCAVWQFMFYAPMSLSFGHAVRRYSMCHTTTTILQPLDRSAYVIWLPQLRTGGFCWSNVLLPTCPFLADATSACGLEKRY